MLDCCLLVTIVFNMTVQSACVVDLANKYTIHEHVDDALMDSRSSVLV